MASTTIPATSKELLARVDESWRGFREAVRHVGRAKMDEQTGGGWTFHDLFAHIAGWHDLTARRLRVFRTEGRFPGYNGGVGGVAPFKDVDEFNARVVSSHRLGGTEALPDQPHTTLRAPRSEIRGLTDAQGPAHPRRGLALGPGN